MTVPPSGAAFFTWIAATWPPLPGRFSITIGRPSSSRSLSEKMRATMSVEPPGGKPTRMRIGRES
jgi:hypothetical protein